MEISTLKLANGAVTDAKLANAAVISNKVAVNAITTPKIVDAAVTEPKIANGAVSNLKVLDGAITSAKVLDQSQPGGGLNSEDINPLNGDLDILDNTITAFDLATNSVDSDEVVDFGLSNQDIGVLFAQIRSDGTVLNSSGGVTALKLSTGIYEVDFGRDVSNCAAVMTQGEGNTGGAPGGITGVTDRAGNVEAFFARMRSDANVLVDRAFQLVVVC